MSPSSLKELNICISNGKKQSLSLFLLPSLLIFQVNEWVMFVITPITSLPSCVVSFSYLNLLIRLCIRIFRFLVCLLTLS